MKKEKRKWTDEEGFEHEAELIIKTDKCLSDEPCCPLYGSLGRVGEENILCEPSCVYHKNHNEWLSKFCIHHSSGAHPSRCVKLNKDINDVECDGCKYYTAKKV